jgi:hypothetical protein
MVPLARGKTPLASVDVLPLADADPPAAALCPESRASTIRPTPPTVTTMEPRVAVATVGDA